MKIKVELLSPIGISLWNPPQPLELPNEFKGLSIFDIGTESDKIKTARLLGKIPNLKIK